MSNKPIKRHMSVNGIELRAWEWAGAEPPLLLAHANGFHGRCWDQVIARLGNQHCFAVDLRGHGGSSKPAPPYEWREIGADLGALASMLDLQGAIGVGHSLGGHAILQAALDTPQAFAALLLIEPVVLPRSYYAGPRPPEHFAARRRNHWASPEAMIARMAEREPFRNWQPAVLHDYCRWGLLPAPNGDGCVLACPPAIEAAIYAASVDADIYDQLGAIDAPVRIIRAGTLEAERTWDMRASATAPDLYTYLRHGEDVYLPQWTHFVPMEAPALIADHLRHMIAQIRAEPAR